MVYGSKGVSDIFNELNKSVYYQFIIKPGGNITYTSSEIIKNIK